MANKYLFADLLIFTSGQGDEATSPFFAACCALIASFWSIARSAHWNTINARGTSPRAHCPRQTNYLFAILLFFTSGEGNEATSPSFVICYAAIEASSALLEVLIATLLPSGGTAKEATFPTAIKGLDCCRIFAFLPRWRAGNSAILGIDQNLQCVVVIIHFSLDPADEFPNDGNIHLPWRARGP